VVTIAVTAIMLAVEDLARAKAFYADGLGCEVEQDYPSFVMLSMGEGSAVALYEREAAAQDAGVSSEGTGFRGVSFHYIVSARDAVDDVIAAATAAGGAVVKAAEASQWGGYYGYFSDPDGYLWKVAANS
jgi:predicted enzyme related to lactoylglutathione lyase